MRDIIFRGKRIDNGEWIEGSLVVAADRYYIYVLIGNELAEFEVDPKTVGEYTGLKDKNGIKIFSVLFFIVPPRTCSAAIFIGCCLMWDLRLTKS